MTAFYNSWKNVPSTTYIESFAMFEVFTSPLHGDGIRANENIKEDIIIFKEKPLHFLQSIPNKLDVLTCSSCLRFLGTIDIQVDYLTKRLARQDLQMLISTGNIDSSINIIPCKYGCGEFYCSNSCCNSHWESYHKLLCTGQISESEAISNPLILFKQHAIRSNEIFLLCADVFAKACITIENGLNKGQSIDEAVNDAVVPYSSYVRKLWWDAAVASSGTNPKVLAKTLKNLVKESWALLSETLSLHERGLAHILSAETLSRTIGMFEQNNVGIRLLSPLGNVIQNLNESDLTVIERFINVTKIIIDQLEGNITFLTIIACASILVKSEACIIIIRVWKKEWS